MTLSHGFAVDTVVHSKMFSASAVPSLDRALDPSHSAHDPQLNGRTGVSSYGTE